MPGKVKQTPQAAPIANENRKVENCKKGHAFGRAFTWVAGKGKQAAKSVARLVKDPCEFARIFRLFVNIVLLGSYATGRENALTTFHAKAGDATEIADTFLIFGDFGYWGEAAVKGTKIEVEKEEKASQFARELRDKKYAMIGARAALLATDVSGTALTLGGFGILKLDAIAEKIGRIPVLGIITKLPLLTFCRGAVTVAYSLLGVNAFQNLVQGWNNNKEKVTHAILKLAHCVSEVGLKVILLAGVTATAVVAPLGILAATLGITSFLYMVNKEKEINRVETIAQKIRALT